MAWRRSIAKRAPWFYRQRFAVFGIVYGLAFFLGYLITALAGISQAPAYHALGPEPLGLTIAGLFVFGGYALRLWASSYLTSLVVTRGDTTQTELRVSGPYRFTRNPLYLGNILQAIGIGLMTPWPALVLVFIGAVALNYALITVEEPFLAATQGEAYARYRDMVPRLVPIPGKVAPPADQRPALAEGLRAEFSIGFFGIVIFIVLAVFSRGSVAITFRG